MEDRELSFSGDRVKAFEALMKHLGNNGPAKIEPEIAIQRLKDHYADYAKPHIFRPGDIVRLKPGLGAISEKLEGQPCIVLEILASPVIGDSYGSPPEYGARLNMRIGALAPSGAFAIALFESALFEPWPNE